MPNVAVPYFKGGGLANLLPYKVSILQAFAKHTVAFLDYRLIDKANYRLPAENSPAQVKWGDTPTEVRDFYGYMNHYETVTTSEVPTTRVVLLGTSKPMNAAYPSAWQRTSRSSVVRDVARRHRMRSFIHPHNVVFENWVGGGRSDWKILQALAEETGYRLWVDGPTVHFLDPVQALSSNATPVEIDAGSLISFKMVGGPSVPGMVPESRRRSVYGMDRRGLLFQATQGDPTYLSDVLTHPSATYGEADSHLMAEERKSSVFYAATAVVRGSSRIHPGALLNLRPSALSADVGGAWLVTEAHHELSGSSHTTQVTLERDKDRLPVVRSVVTPRATGGFAEEATIRTNDVWEARVQEHINV